MGILSKFGIGKKKREPEKPPAKEKKDKAEDKAELKESAQSLEKKPGKAAQAGDLGRSHSHLIRPIISEKATSLVGIGKYVFSVSLRANKSEIRKSVEKVYGVDVESVNIIKMPGKTRRYGKTTGRTSSWKKAVVTVKSGQKIPGIIENVGN